MLYELDQECKDFLQGVLSNKQVVEAWYTSITQLLLNNGMDVVPFNIDEILKGPQPLSELKNLYVFTDVNMGKDLGVVVLTYDKVNTLINSEYGYIIVLVAKGVILDVALAKLFPEIVARNDAVVCDNNIMVMRGFDENALTVIVNHDGKFCTRTTYVLKTKDGKLYKEEIFPVDIGVSDEECQSLLSGSVTDNPEAFEFGGIDKEKKRMGVYYLYDNDGDEDFAE